LIEQAHCAGALAFFVQGCGGDINPVRYKGGQSRPRRGAARAIPGRPRGETKGHLAPAGGGLPAEDRHDRSRAEPARGLPEGHEHQLQDISSAAGPAAPGPRVPVGLRPGVSCDCMVAPEWQKIFETNAVEMLRGL
jgi:hypothetical protein